MDRIPIDDFLGQRSPPEKNGTRRQTRQRDPCNAKRKARPGTDSYRDQCGNGLELIARLDGLINLAWEYDGGRLTPEDLQQPEKPVYGGNVGSLNTNPQAKPTNAAKRKNGEHWQLLRIDPQNLHCAYTNAR